MAIYKSSNTGIPFGNTSGRPSSASTGQPYFNGELQRLELYTGATYGWQNIVAETPTVTGYSGTIIETNSTNTVTITGTSFVSGAVAYLIGDDSTEYTASVTTVNNPTSITAQFGVIPANNEPYDIKVVNPSNLYGIYYNALSVNDKPAWSTTAGSLGTFTAGDSISTQLSVTDEESDTITYSVSSGSLPSGVTLSSSGLISGSAPSVDSSTTYSFTIAASDSVNTSQTRSFSITSTPFEAGTLAYFDFASGKSYNPASPSTLLDLSGRGKNLPKSNGTYSSTNGGIIVTSGEQGIRSTGLIGSITSISMGVWVKLDGATNRGIIYYGDNAMNNHFYIRDGINDTAYNFDVGKDISSVDTWTKSKYNGSNMRNYITGVSGYSSKYWFYVVRINSSGLVECSLNGSNFETVVNANVNMSGHTSGQFGIAGDPYNDNSSSHTYGGAWWYQGQVSQAQVNSEWNRYNTRFGW